MVSEPAVLMATIVTSQVPTVLQLAEGVEEVDVGGVPISNVQATVSAVNERLKPNWQPI